MAMENHIANVLVVGAGISGIHASLDLAGIGHKVCLIDRASAAGGILLQLDHQFPNNHCGMCRMLPMIDRDACSQFCVRKGLFHENIEFIPRTELVSIKGSPGRFTVTLSKRPLGVDPALCTGCGDCESKCPVIVPDEFNSGLETRKAIFLPIPHQVDKGRVIDWNACTRCGACVDACPEDAIDLAADKSETFQMESVGAVILAAGVELFDPGSTDIYGFGRLPNVVTATGFERLMSSSGPNEGRFQRPSDEREIRKVAWLQCVGSRNIMINADYCSSVCCMFAVKEAVLFHEKAGQGAESTIFYMDMRTFGRDFQRYRDRAEKETGVRFVRCRVHSIESAESDGDLRVSYVDKDGTLVDEIFDMVVLSTGGRAKDGFSEFRDLEGVYSISSSLGFKDISESIISGSAISGRTAGMLRKIGMAPFLMQDKDGEEDSDTARIVTKAALVVGGGPAGMAAALSLAAYEVDVTLVEKSDRIGGNLPNIRGDIRDTVQKLVTETENHPRIKIYPESELVQSLGRPGRFVSRIRSRSGDEESIRHGATIIATGGRAAETSVCLHGEHDRVVTLFELEKLIDEPAFANDSVNRVVMIQCVESREEPRNYCSRICCIKSLENAIRIKELHPDAEVWIFYRDMMTYGESEQVYTEARGKGVLFIPFDPGNRPDVRLESGRIVVEGFDSVSGAPVRLEPDWLSLAQGVVPNSVHDLTQALGMKKTQDGFVKEADSKWRPVDTGREGIFVCGLARAPARADEAMQEGEAAAQRALRILARDVVHASGVTARVRHYLCSLCGKCIEACAYDARYIDPEEERIVVDPVSCQGCGACAAVCPNSATVIRGFEDNSIMDAIEAAL